MTGVALPAGSPRSIGARIVGYGAGGAGLVLAGLLVAGVTDRSLAPLTGALAFAAALALVAFGLRRRVLSSPTILLGVPLLLSLAAAMQPITRIFDDWTPTGVGVVTVIVLAPIVGVALATLATGGRIPVPTAGTAGIVGEPRAHRLVVSVLAMTVAGTAVYASEWANVGGPPILSTNIDEARFALVGLGPLHVLTEGVPLALLIAAWARVARPQSFSSLERRLLEGVMVFVPLVLVLSGSRTLVIMPLLAALVVTVRYLSHATVKRLLIVLPLTALVFSAGLQLVRVGQLSSVQAPQAALHSSSTQVRTTPLESGYNSLAISLGEQLRVVSALREHRVSTGPFTSSLWFAHYVFPSAVNPHDITAGYAGGWFTSMYAGQVLLDFGLLGTLLFGLVLGAIAHLLYRRFARGTSVAMIWVYAYLAGPLALMFYINTFLFFIFPIIDVIGLLVLSRALIECPAPDAERLSAGDSGSAVVSGSNGSVGLALRAP